jgi:hypothetical protein
MDGRRDIELVLLGIAITKSERERVMILPDEAFSKEFVPLISSIRKGKPADLFTWLRARGLSPEKGTEVIDLLVRHVSDMNDRERIKMILGALDVSTRIETVSELKARVRNALSQI